MTAIIRRSAPLLLAALLCGCGPNYSPNTYSSTAVQQANKVDQGVVVGVRRVDISAQSGVGAATGAAAGGIAGSQSGDGVTGAIGALGGAVVGGIIGNAVDHKVNDTFGYEYIVRKPNKDLLSVTQKDDVPLAIGQHVLLIAGAQARIVADYTVPVDMEVEKPTATEHVEPAPTTKAPEAQAANPSSSAGKAAIPPEAAHPPADSDAAKVTESQTASSGSDSGKPAPTAETTHPQAADKPEHTDSPADAPASDATAKPVEDKAPASDAN